MATIYTLLQQTQVVVADSSLCAALHPLLDISSSNLAISQEALETRNQYLASGARLFLTNTFDAGRLHLEHLGLAHQASELNERAALLTKELFADVTSSTAVAGSIGLLPEHASHAELVNTVAEQVEALARGGVDLLWAESLSTIGQIDALLAGCALGAPQLDLVLTLAFRPNPSNPFQLTPATAAKRLANESQIRAIGVDTTSGDWRIEQSLAALKSASQGQLLATKADSDTLVVNTHGGASGVRQLTQMARTVAQLGTRIFALDRAATVEQLRAVNETLNPQSSTRLAVR